jgi:hypothetical protein
MKLREEVARAICTEHEECGSSNPEQGCDPYCDTFHREMLAHADAALAVFEKWLREYGECRGISLAEVVAAERRAGK